MLYIDNKKFKYSDDMLKSDKTVNHNLVNKIYNNALTLFFGSDDTKKSEIFHKRFNKKMASIEISDLSQITSDEDPDEKLYGYVNINSEGQMKMHLCGENCLFKYSKRNIYNNIAHELMHTISAVNITDHDVKQENDFKYNVDEYGIIVSDDKNLDLVLEEVTNEFLARLVTQKYYHNKDKTIDQILKSKNRKRDKYLYLNSMPVVKLLIASFNNNAKSDHEMVFDGTPLINRKIKMNNGKIKPTNTFLYAIVTDPTIIIKEYDHYMGNGEAFKLFKSFDNLEELTGQKEIGLAAKNMMFQIALFQKKRSLRMLKDHEISTSDWSKMEDSFDNIFDAAKSNYHYRVYQNDKHTYMHNCRKINDCDKTYNNLQEIKMKKLTR